MQSVSVSINAINETLNRQKREEEKAIKNYILFRDTR
jgi:hypothetical protein